MKLSIEGKEIIASNYIEEENEVEVTVTTEG